MRADNIRDRVARLRGRLLSGEDPSDATAGVSPPYGNVEVDAARADSTLSNIESDLDYLESRIG